MMLFGRLFLLFRPYWGWLLLGVLTALAALIGNIALMSTSGWFITTMGIAGVTGIAVNYFTPAAMIRGAAILRTAGRYAERLVTHEATFRLIAALRVWLFKKIEPLPPGALDPWHSADVESRLRADLDHLETIYLRVFLPFIVAVLAAALVLVWLGMHHPAFALAEGVCLVLSGLALPLLLTQSSAAMGRARVRLSARMGEMAVDAIQGMAELLAFGAAGRHAERFAALSKEATQLQARMGRRFGLAQAGLLLGGHLALWSLIVLAIPLVRQQMLAPADMVMIGLCGLAAFEAIAPLPNAFLAAGGALESARRVFALADSSPPIPAESGIRERPQRCDIAVRDLLFTYPGAAHPALNGLSFDLPQGKRLAVIGPTGSGKSTLILLLAGLLTPDRGGIALDGRPLSAFDPETLRSCFAVAPQGGGLFSGTVRDSLKLARPDAGDSEMWRVLALAGLDSFVATLPDGLDSWLGEAGLTLSGGQARRLSIARALLKDAPVVILDEPGEGLDYRTERDMLDAVIKALDGRSLLLITHRSNGLDRMDEVLTL